MEFLNFRWVGRVFFLPLACLALIGCAAAEKPGYFSGVDEFDGSSFEGWRVFRLWLSSRTGFERLQVDVNIFGEGNCLLLLHRRDENWLFMEEVSMRVGSEEVVNLKRHEDEGHTNVEEGADPLTGEVMVNEQLWFEYGGFDKILEQWVKADNEDKLRVRLRGREGIEDYAIVRTLESQAGYGGHLSVYGVQDVELVGDILRRCGKS